MVQKWFFFPHLNMRFQEFIGGTVYYRIKYQVCQAIYVFRWLPVEHQKREMVDDGLTD